jgi:hypothetical protein
MFRVWRRVFIAAHFAACLTAAFCATNCHYRRISIERMRLAGARVTLVPPSQKWWAHLTSQFQEPFWPVRRITLDGVDICNSVPEPQVGECIDSIAVALKRIHFANELVICRCSLGPQDVEVLGTLRGIESISIVDCRITTNDLSPLMLIRGLREIDLCGSNVNDSAIESLGQMAGVSSLDLGFSEISNQTVLNLRGCQSLEFVNLQGTNCSRAAINKFQQSRPGTKVMF